MPAPYKLLTALIALTGNLSLVITGELSPLFIVSGSAMFIGYYRAVRGYPQASRLIVGGLSTLAILIFLYDAFVISGDIIIGVAHLTLIFHAIKSFDIKDHWDSLQVFFMSLIQLLLASELTRSMVFGVVFVIFMVIMVFSISYSHLIKEKNRRIRPFIRPVGAVALLVLFMTGILFVSLPRLKGRLWGKEIGRGIKSGFSETVKFGSFGEVKLDPTVVMRITIGPEQNYRPYWRGMTFEIYSNDSWYDIKEERQRYINPEGVFRIKDTEEAATLIKQEILLEPLNTDIIFTLRDTTKLVTESKYLLTDISGSLFIPRKRSKRIRYTAFSTDKPLPVSEAISVYLQLPDGMQKLKRLTDNVVKEGRTDLERATAIEQYLKQNYTYSLKVDPPPSGISPIEDFLFRTKRGYCEHYATSMVFMLRSIGIPARVVSGFLGGEYNKYGHYLIVRQSNAHTWVEADIDGMWITFDPTPALQQPVKKKQALLLYLDLLKLRWERYVVGFSRFDQMRLFKFISLPFSLPGKVRSGVEPKYIIQIFSFTLLIGVLFLLLRIFRRPNRHTRVSKYYLNTRRRLSKRMPVKDSYTAGDIMAVLKDGMDKERMLLINEFFDLYGKIRFSKYEDKEVMIRYEDIYRTLRRKL